MQQDLQRAKALLREGNYTCVFCCGEQTYTSRKRGVLPLLELLDGGEPLRDFCVADKVVGGAAAFLYALLGVRALHASVMSERAQEVLAATDITVSFDLLVPLIKNRRGDGFCPMETATKDIAVDDPPAALAAIRKTLAEAAF